MNQRLPITNLELSADTLLQSLCQEVCCALRHRGRSHPSPDEVEELSQEIFFQLTKDNHRRLRSFDPQRGPFEIWLRRVVKREVDHYLQGQRRTRSLEAIELDRFISLATQEDAVLFQERKALLQAFACKLSQRQGQMLKLLLQDGLSDTERAEAMGLKPAAFRTLKYETRKKLREFVDKLGGGRSIRAGVVRNLKKFALGALTFSVETPIYT